MSNMLVRAISGSVYVALIVACILLGAAPFFVLILAFIVLAINELENLLSTKAYISRTARILDMSFALSIALMAISFWIGLYTYPHNFEQSVSSPILNIIITFAFLLALVITFLYIPLRIIIAVTTNRPDQAKAFFYSIGSIVYIAIPLTLLICLYSCFEGYKYVLMIFILIWLNDTGAYLSGRAFGKHKLCERLSPKKTWEGFWGGLIITALGAALCGYLLFEKLNIGLVVYAVIGALVSVLATYGDLFESLIKRSLGVKDSGKLIPGHGGILDRIDSLLLAVYVAPAIFIAICLHVNL